MPKDIPIASWYFLFAFVDPEMATFLMRPPPTNPNYAQTPYTLRASASRFHNFLQNPSTEPSAVPPPADSAPPCEFPRYIRYSFS